MKKNAILGLVFGVVLIGVLVFLFLQVRSLNAKFRNLEWSSALQGEAETDTIIPNVGTIQFLKRGYSIQVENVKYTADGLYLKGFIGNPLNIWVSNLTLSFAATKQLYQYRDEWNKQKISWLFMPTPIGSAQSSIISSLKPGQRAPFEATIPNVKQVKEGVRVTVQFTGERYSYPL